MNTDELGFILGVLVITIGPFGVIMAAALLWDAWDQKKNKHSR